MNHIDLTLLFGTIVFIVVYGVWKTRKQQNIEGYLKGDNSLKWGTVGLSVMATQASAITFISTPGQAFESGMAFVQNYFGLPIALMIVSFVFIPIYFKLKVYTAYEYLETRFDLKTRALGAFLFLLQRGLAAGITIYAPAIILSTILDWHISFTIILTGVLVIIYTASGGTRAVSVTQKQQMIVIMGGMFLAFFILINYIQEYVSFPQAIKIASVLGKMEAIDFSFDFEKRYTFWSGITAGLFLSLSYFGTDQSQVQRYLGGKDASTSKIGLMFNAIFKIPMQYFILFLGVMVYVFYIFNPSPVHFTPEAVKQLSDVQGEINMEHLQNDFKEATDARKSAAIEFIASGKDSLLIKYDKEVNNIRLRTKSLMQKEGITDSENDSDYVFLTFILNYLPHGIIGLLIAVIISAAMSSTSGEINALASTTSIDFYKRLIKPVATEKHYLNVSRLLTGTWGGIAIIFAFVADSSENLIEAVNIIGSLFYGTVLGIFLCAFFVSFVKGTAVFWGAILGEGAVLAFHFLTKAGIINIGYLWYNLIGCLLTIVFSMMLQSTFTRPKHSQ